MLLKIVTDFHANSRHTVASRNFQCKDIQKSYICIMKHLVGIYKITNPKGKIYIGQSVNVIQRRYYNIKAGTLLAQLCGQNSNKTNLVYA